MKKVLASILGDAFHLLGIIFLAGYCCYKALFVFEGFESIVIILLTAIFVIVAKRNLQQDIEDNLKKEEKILNELEREFKSK